MTELLKQVITLVKDLSFEEVEVLQTTLFNINYKRKEKIRAEIDIALNPTP